MLAASIRDWMTSATTTASNQLKGSVSRGNVPDPEVYERANYYQVMHSWNG
jgi:dihydroorotate dehydrogenase (fumarate)